MASSETVVLPSNTNFGLVALANSAGAQTFTISVDGKETDKFTLTDAHHSVKMYNSGSKGNVSVAIEVNGNASKMQKKSSEIGKSHFVVIGSEDGSDGDYNDGIVMMNWPLG